LQIYCELEHQERRRRFTERNESGERHAGHVDAHGYDDLDHERDSQTYGPLNVGEFRRVNTMVFGDAEYELLLREVEAFIKG
jgi:hypothetical protein